jgi:hypothetical protein
MNSLVECIVECTGSNLDWVTWDNSHCMRAHSHTEEYELWGSSPSVSDQEWAKKESGRYKNIRRQQVVWYNWGALIQSHAAMWARHAPYWIHNTSLGHISASKQVTGARLVIITQKQEDVVKKLCCWGN